MLSGNGVYTDGQTTYINAAICNVSYKPIQPAYVFDLPVRLDGENGTFNGIPPPYPIDSGGSDEGEIFHSITN